MSWTPSDFRQRSLKRSVLSEEVLDGHRSHAVLELGCWSQRPGFDLGQVAKPLSSHFLRSKQSNDSA